MTGRSSRVPFVTDVDELACRARAGEPGAFDDLVRATYADAFALARRMTGDDHDAGDAVQEAYLRAYRALPRFRGDAAFTTWLYRITANCAARVLERRSRGRGRQVALDTVVAPDREPRLAESRPDHLPEPSSLDRSELSRLGAAMDELPDRLRAVVVLRDVYDLPHQVIADELGISVTAAKVRLHRARHQLRQRLFAEETAGETSGEVPAETAPPAHESWSRAG